MVKNISKIPNLLLLNAARLIQKADALLICANNGIEPDAFSREDERGFTLHHSLLKNTNNTLYDLASAENFIHDPKNGWRFYSSQYQHYLNKPPNNGMEILRKWSSQKTETSFVFTTLVNENFQKAGFKDSQIVEHFGSINHHQCINDFGRPCFIIWKAEEDSNSFAINANFFTSHSSLPRCPKCSAIARPNIYMPNDYYWLSERTDAQYNRFTHWRNNCNNLKKKIVVIEIGNGSKDSEIRNISDSMNTNIIRINPKERNSSEHVISIPLEGLEALKKIDELFN